MDHLTARRQRLWEAMESCRRGTDDLSDPQFAELAARLAEDPELRGQFERLQQADGAIKVAFARVPVPAGLADRVSRRLAEIVPTPASGSLAKPTLSLDNLTLSNVTLGDVTLSNGAEPTLTTPDSPAPRQKQAGRFSRRRLLVGFTALTAAAGLLAAVWIQTHPPRHDTPTSVLEEAMDFFDKDSQPFGELVSLKPPPAEFPLSRDIARLQGIRWRPVQKFLSGPAVAYDLPTNVGRATLYVVQRTIPGLPAIPPSIPLSTGGKSAAAWQVGSTVYVLVVEGNAGMYRGCLDQSHGPLT